MSSLGVSKTFLSIFFGKYVIQNGYKYGFSLVDQELHVHIWSILRVFFVKKTSLRMPEYFLFKETLLVRPGSETTGV